MSWHLRFIWQRAQRNTAHKLLAQRIPPDWLLLAIPFMQGSALS